MIIQNIYLDDFDWHITVYYAVDTLHILDIIDDLVSNGCNGDQLVEAKGMLWNGKTGFTYSDTIDRQTIIVIGKCDTAEEYCCSIKNQKNNTVKHIIQANRISPGSEKACSLSNELSRKMFNKCRKLLCNCCRRMIRRNS